ncbi:MAG TPA: TonB-dependent receptor [Opitutaceae bacterium]|nr:TonB-dependent receptor [Opitutaceae bacterium]
MKRLLSALALLASALHSQTIPTPALHVEGDVVHLENFVVTASPSGGLQDELPQPTSVLADREVGLRMTRTLGELLAGQPGVSSTYFGPNASRPVIRGLGNDRIRVLENSLGSIDASVISPDHAVSLDPLLIERIEVVRGPAALLYGGNAVGGVVNVITHRIHTSLPDAPLLGRIEARGGTADDEQSAGLVLEGAAGQLAWHADYYRRDTEDVEIPGFAESARLRAMDEDHDDERDEEPAFGTIPNTALNNEGGAFGLTVVGDRGFVGLAFSAHDSVYGVPAGAHAHHPDEEDEDEEEHIEDEEAVRIDLRQRRWEFQAEITEPFGPFRGARLKFGTSDYRHAELEGDEIGTVFRNEGYDGRLELLHQPLGVLTGAIGLQGGRSLFEAVGEEAFLPPSRTLNRAAFLFEEMELGDLTLQFGARVENQDIELRDGSGISRDDSLASASTGLVWKISDTWTLGASLARTQRAPNVQELFADGPHIGTNNYEVGDPALSRERSLALDVTLRKRVGMVTGALTVFANDFDRFVFDQPTGLVAVEHDGEWEFRNPDDEEAEGGLEVFQFVQRDARFQGAELEAVVHLHESGEGAFDLILGADIVRARNRSDGGHLPRITPARAKVGFEWTRGPLSLGGEVQFVARQNRVSENETPTSGYELASAYANYRFGSGRVLWDLFVRGTNLGDREARLHNSVLKEVAPLPGRNFVAGVRAAF